MKSNLIAILFISISLIGQAQKPPLDTCAFRQWPHIINIQISSDGHYATYTMTEPADQRQVLTIASLDRHSQWHFTAPSFSRVQFSPSGASLCFLQSTDSLCIVTLCDTSFRYLPATESFQWVSVNGKDVLVHLQKGSKNLRISSIGSGKEISYNAVTSYYVHQKTGAVVLLSHDSLQPTLQRIYYARIEKGKASLIWQGMDCGDFTFDTAGNQLTFTGRQSEKTELDRCLYYYTPGQPRATLLIDPKQPLLRGQYTLTTGWPIHFTDEGGALIFGLTATDSTGHHASHRYSRAIVWDYKDTYLPTEQEQESGFAEPLTAVYNVANKNLIFENPNENTPFLIGQTKDYLLTVSKYSVAAFYKNQTASTLSLLATKDGSRKTIVLQKKIDLTGFSPDGQYVLWFDRDSLSYFSYQVRTGTVVNITKTVGAPLYDPNAAQIGRRYVSFTPAAWDTKTHAVFLRGPFDLWKIDLRGQAPPQNITNDFGRRNAIVFSFVSDPSSIDHLLHITQNKLLLSGFSKRTKFNGFWEIDGAHPKNDPIERSMQSECTYLPSIGSVDYPEYSEGFAPLKAGHIAIFLTEKMTASTFPNLYATTDFKQFDTLSHLHPESAYNWLTTELVTWTLPDGTPSQGILYKPENFDPHKKYPLIFDYYMQRSDELNKYIWPDFSISRLNIPYFVSHGYLIFVPDLHYVPNHPGLSALASIESAAEYLCTKPWIDGTRLGLQGHSFGGWETNFFVTHSKRFAAACEAAGVSDVISAYDELNYTGFPRQAFYEYNCQGTPYGDNVTPWTAPNVYAENSPVLHIDSVTTPLLIMHGDKDAAVPFPQALEMFLALRRAQKKVWLLEYPDADHTLYPADAADFTIRLKQFFDFYLKDCLPPLWMTTTLSANLKAGDPGLNLDSTGRHP